METVDLCVLLVYLLAVAGLGIYLGRGTRDLSGYLLGDRHLPWWAILGSIVATETSTATFLSVPGITYARQGDLRFLQLAIGYLIGRVLIVFLLLPQYFRGQIFTAYQILEQRFGGATKQAASLIFLIARNLGDGLRLFLTAIALREVAGVSLPACVVLIGVITIAYTLLGGMKAVVWNDCLQFVIYMIGGLIAGWVILQGIPGGWQGFVEFGQRPDAWGHAKFQIWDFRVSLVDPYAFWTAVVGGMFLTLGTHGTDQMMVQRLLCASRQREAGWALVLSGGVVLLQFLLFLLLGVGLAAFYNAHPPDTPFTRNDRVFATFIVTELPAGKGIIGLVLAAVFAAAMSTLSSSINSSAASAVNDLYLPLHRSATLSDAAQLRLGKWMTVVFGVIQILVGIGAQNLQQSVVEGALAIAGFSAGLLLGIFTLGVGTRHVQQAAAAGGLLLATATLMFVRFLLPLAPQHLLGYVAPQFIDLLRPMGGTDTIPRTVVAWPWYPVIGSAVTVVGGLAGQFFLDLDRRRHRPRWKAAS